jgi:hypothetical protein
MTATPTLNCAQCGYLIEGEPRRDNAERPLHPSASARRAVSG